MQVSITAADTCSGTLQYCPELVGHSEGGTTGLAYVDKPVKPQHAPADCGFNVQYERVSSTPSRLILHPQVGPQADLRDKHSDGLQARRLANLTEEVALLSIL